MVLDLTVYATMDTFTMKKSSLMNKPIRAHYPLFVDNMFINNCCKEWKYIGLSENRSTYHSLCVITRFCLFLICTGLSCVHVCKGQSCIFTLLTKKGDEQSSTTWCKCVRFAPKIDANVSVNLELNCANTRNYP